MGGGRQAPGGGRDRGGRAPRGRIVARGWLGAPLCVRPSHGQRLRGIAGGRTGGSRGASPAARRGSVRCRRGDTGLLCHAGRDGRVARFDQGFAAMNTASQSQQRHRPPRLSTELDDPQRGHRPGVDALSGRAARSGAFARLASSSPRRTPQAISRTVHQDENAKAATPTRSHTNASMLSPARPSRTLAIIGSISGGQV